MNKTSLILFTWFLIFNISFIYTQESQMDKNFEDFKSAKFKNHYELFNNCYVDGLINTVEYSDSINRFSILVPFGHNISIKNKEGYRETGFYPDKMNSLTDVIMKIKILDVQNRNFEVFFDNELKMKMKNEMVFQLGNHNFNGDNAYFIESVSPNNSKEKFCSLSFYFLQPITKKIIVISLKSSKRKKFRRIFCANSIYIESIKLF